MALVQPVKQFISKVDKNGNKIRPKEEKVYLILLYLLDESKTFELAVTRRLAFDACCQYAKDADLVKSQVMTDKHTMQDSISLYSFMRMCFEKEKEAALETEITIEELNDWCSENGDNPEQVWKEDGFLEEDEV